MKLVELKAGLVGTAHALEDTAKLVKTEAPVALADAPAAKLAEIVGAEWQAAPVTPVVAQAPAPITKFTIDRNSANAKALASRQGDSDPFASRAQIRLEKVATAAEAAAKYQGRTVKYSISPEVTAFFEALSGNDSKALKALIDDLVAPKLNENAQPGKRFVLAMNPEFTDKQRTAMIESLKLGGSATTLDEKLTPLVLKPH